MPKSLVRRSTATHAVPAVAFHAPDGASLTVSDAAMREHRFVAGMVAGAALGVLLTAAVLARRRVAA